MVQGWLDGQRRPAFGGFGQECAVTGGCDPDGSPKARSGQDGRLYAWLIGKPADTAALPQVVQDLLAFRAEGDGDCRTCRSRCGRHAAFARTMGWWRRGSWAMLRQGLNMLDPPVPSVPGVAVHVADVLRDQGDIRAAGRCLIS